MVTSPNHEVARWLTEKLEPVRHRLATHMLNSFNHIKNVVKSLDLICLRTNILLFDTINKICEVFRHLPVVFI